MFASLKNKIKEETGSEVGPHQQQQQQRLANNNHNNNRLRSRFSSTYSVNSATDDCSGNGDNMSDQLTTLRGQCNELTTKVTDLSARLQTLYEEKQRVEKTNEILLESVRVAQTQKDIYCEDQEKIQNMQQHEIDKLKNLLSYREQEAVDRLAAIRQSQQQVENLTAEIERLKQFEPVAEDLQDEVERLRHASQLDKNNLTTIMAAMEEENRYLKMRLQIMEKARLDALQTLSADEKVKALVQERKLLEQHLEEAHLQLSDIKSSWSGQNLALETQVSRLSKQVAEETTEKRKALTTRDAAIEKVKQLEFEMLKLNDEIRQRDTKIKLLDEEIDETNLALKTCRDDNEQQILFERNRSEILESENKDLKARIDASDDRFTEYASNAERVAQTLRQQNQELQEKLELEKEEKLTALLRNAEISQSEELLKKELRMERDETNEVLEQNLKLQTEMKAKQQEVADGKLAMDELKTVMLKNDKKLKEIDEMQREISEKNKTIKLLNQRLADLKKTVQNEFRSSKSFEASSNGHVQITTNTATAITAMKITCNNCGINAADSAAVAADVDTGNVIIMDEVNFKYLKHVIVKFLTSREVEARHLLRAVATLLKLSKEEEKLLHDTLNWKMSWFGAKPNHGSGQLAFSIPPS